MKRRYLSQGDLDGACFLYSIANSVVALTSRQPTVLQWSRALQYIPFSADFLDGTLGTDNYKDNSELHAYAVEQALSELSPNEQYEVRSYPEIATIDQLPKLLSDRSTIILNLSGDHWVCVVDLNVENAELLCACSDIYGEALYEYSEKRCSLGRYYNRIYPIGSDYTIYQPGVIGIELKS